MNQRFLSIWNIYSKTVFLPPGLWEYNKEQMCLTIKYCDASSSVLSSYGVYVLTLIWTMMLFIIWELLETIIWLKIWGFWPNVDSYCVILSDFSLFKEVFVEKESFMFINSSSKVFIETLTASSVFHSSKRFPDSGVFRIMNMCGVFFFFPFSILLFNIFLFHFVDLFIQIRMDPLP